MTACLSGRLCVRLRLQYEGAKIFIDATDSTDTNSKIQNQQNNFTQINRIPINAEQLNELPIDKQRHVDEILRLIKRWVCQKFIFTRLVTLSLMKRN